jgi:hypothetical protein
MLFFKKGKVLDKDSKNLLVKILLIKTLGKKKRCSGKVLQGKDVFF